MNAGFRQKSYKMKTRLNICDRKPIRLREIKTCKLNKICSRENTRI